ncbi:MAG: heme NO-binding domain-containing protein [Cyclobacteriaceae bacterium]
MYGIVNKAIQGLVTENFGEPTWHQVKEKSGIKEDLFLSSESYPDSMTYELAGAASEVLGISLREVLIAFGEYWILKTGKESYGALMQAGGSNLKEFFINLPNFHSRVMLMYPKLSPPEFQVSSVQDNSLHLHYYSHREGLEDFVHGLILGLGKLFDTVVDITLLQSRNEGADHEVFLVKW